MNISVVVEPLKAFTDARGTVVEPLHADGFAEQRNGHLVLTNPGGIRGNHYHPKGTETCLVLGPTLVRYRDREVTHDVTVAEGESVRFVFPPGVPHAMKNIGNQPTVLFSFNTVAHDPSNPDVVREVLIPT